MNGRKHPRETFPVIRLVLLLIVIVSCLAWAVRNLNKRMAALEALCSVEEVK